MLGMRPDCARPMACSSRQVSGGTWGHWRRKYNAKSGPVIVRTAAYPFNTALRAKPLPVELRSEAEGQSNMRKQKEPPRLIVTVNVDLAACLRALAVLVALFA